MTTRRTVTILSGLACLVAWIALAFVVPVGAGWPHLLLPAGLLLIIHAVVDSGTRPRGTEQ